MSNKKSIVPELRFPEFEGDWEEKELHDACDMKAGKFVKASEINEIQERNTFPCFGGNGLRGFTTTFTHSGRYPLIGRQGAHCGNVTLAEDCFHATEHAIVASPKEKIEVTWLYYALVYLRLNQYATGQAQPGLSVSNLEKVPLQIPKTEKEQQKIADCLSSLDALIAAHRDKLDALRAHKKGLMQNLFPQEGERVPRYRFEGFEGAWEEKALGRIADNLDSRRIPITSNKREKGEIPYYGASGIIDYVKDYIFDDDLLLISEDGANLIARNYPIAFSISGKSWVNNHAHVLKFENWFTQVMTENILNSKNLEDFLSGMAQPKLNRKKLDTIPIVLPQSKEEQQKIADCLSSVDELIAAQEERIEQLQKHKRGLMQGLFPKVD